MATRVGVMVKGRAKKTRLGALFRGVFSIFTDEGLKGKGGNVLYYYYC